MRARDRLQPDRPKMLFVQSRRFPSRESYATWLFDFLRVDFATIPPGQTQDWQREAKEFVDLGEGAVIELTEAVGCRPASRCPPSPSCVPCNSNCGRGYRSCGGGSATGCGLRSEAGRSGREDRLNRESARIFPKSVRQCHARDGDRVVDTHPDVSTMWPPFPEGPETAVLLTKLFSKNPVRTVRGRAAARLPTRIRAGREEETETGCHSSSEAWASTPFRPHRDP